MAKVVFGKDNFLNDSDFPDSKKRAEQKRGKNPSQMECISKWMSHNGYEGKNNPKSGEAKNLVFAWSGKQPNNQFTHTHDCTKLENNRGDGKKGIKIDGRYYQSVENYFQAEKMQEVLNQVKDDKWPKYNNPKDIKKIKGAIEEARNGTPKEAFDSPRTKLGGGLFKKKGKNINQLAGEAFKDESITEDRKLEIMRQGNEAKYSQHPELMNNLLEIKENGGLIVEASPNDQDWGIKKQQGHGDIGDPGKNQLGTELDGLAGKFMEQGYSYNATGNEANMTKPQQPTYDTVPPAPKVESNNPVYDKVQIPDPQDQKVIYGKLPNLEDYKEPVVHGPLTKAEAARTATPEVDQSKSVYGKLPQGPPAKPAKSKTSWPGPRPKKPKRTGGDSLKQSSRNIMATNSSNKRKSKGLTTVQRHKTPRV